MHAIIGHGNDLATELRILDDDELVGGRHTCRDEFLMGEDIIKLLPLSVLGQLKNRVDIITLTMAARPASHTSWSLMPTYAVIACAEHTKLELDLEQLLRRLSMAFDIPKHTTLIRPDSEASPEHRRCSSPSG